MNAITPPLKTLHAEEVPSEGPVYDARLLVGHGGIARIRLDGMVYTLRITKAGKLILTK